jgi:hypothetical protein
VGHGYGDGGGASLLGGREVVGGREGDEGGGDDGELHFECGEDDGYKVEDEVEGVECNGSWEHEAGCCYKRMWYLKRMESCCEKRVEWLELVGSERKIPLPQQRPRIYISTMRLSLDVDVAPRRAMAGIGEIMRPTIGRRGGQMIACCGVKHAVSAAPVFARTQGCVQRRGTETLLLRLHLHALSNGPRSGLARFFAPC